MTLNRRASSIVPLLAWAAGMLMLFRPILFSGFRITLYGLGDVRLVNFMLEHSYRWATGQYPHLDFWSPPVFFPHQNVAAYSELVIGVAAPYWLLRALEFTPVTSFLVWVLCIWTLNFVAAYLVFRRLFAIEVLGASLGAFLFAFGNPRSADIFHQQLQPSFYLIAAFSALCCVFAGPAEPARRRGWIAVFGVALVLQAYTAFYPFYFFGMCLLVAALWAMAVPQWRQRLFAALRRDGWVIGGVGLVSLAALVPMLTHYLRAADEVGLRNYPLGALPRLASWLLMGQRHPWYGWLQQTGGPFRDLRETLHSHGVGPLTTVLALIGLYWAWKKRGARLLVLVVGTLIAVTTLYPGGYSGWRLLYDYLPGAAALRAVARIGMITLLPLSLGVAVFFGRLWERRRWVLLTVLAAVMIAEQNHEVQFRRRAPVEAYVAGLADSLQPGCEAFLLVYVGRRPYPHVHDDAAWITLATGVPTLNGRYGNIPPEYRLYDVQIRNQRDREGIRRAMDYWIEINDLPGPRVCWIETRGFPPPG